MNSSDTQHVNKPHGATVLSPAESQMLQSSLLAMANSHGDNASSGPPALASTPTLTALLQALKRRWMVGFGLAVLAATLMGLSVFSLMPPRYHASFRLRVAALVRGTEDVEFPIYKANMEALVKSPLVISNALNDKTEDGREIKDLEIVKAKGMGAVEWLEKALKTDYLLGPEVLRVTLAADEPKEAAELLSAICKAFLNEYAEMERSKKQQRLTELRGKKERNEEELRQLRNQLDREFKALSAKDRDAATIEVQRLINKQAALEAFRLNNADGIAKAKSKKITYEARLTNLDKTPIPDRTLYEYLGKHPEIASLTKKIFELQEQIDRAYSDYNEPFASQKADPFKNQKNQAAKLKENKEKLLKPTIEEIWRKETNEELRTGIALTIEEIAEGERVGERLVKEITELDIAIKRSGFGSEAPAIIAIKDKIEMSKRSMGNTGDEISKVEIEPLASRITVMLPPGVPSGKDRSQQTKIAGAGGLGVFIMALFGVAFLEFRARKINLPEEVAQGLGLNVVGTIPAMPPRSKKPDPAAEQAWQSQLQESVDAIRTVLMHQARSEALHVIMVTSASQGEGKTTLATQLAASLSRAWKRVLVVDGDLRHSAVHKLFNVPQEPGLAEVLRGEVEASDAVQATALSRLWVLPAGNGDVHAIQALAQDNVRTLFEQFKQQYDFIIIDTPPVLPVTDSLLLGQHVDGVLFSVLKDVSRAPAIYAAQQKLAPLQVRTLGAVVLGADAEFDDKTYGYAK